jgi:hypothetical protein
MQKPGERRCPPGLDLEKWSQLAARNLIGLESDSGEFVDRVASYGKNCSGIWIKFMLRIVLPWLDADFSISHRDNPRFSLSDSKKIE